MPITLITGPANSEKARVVLDAYRAALSREPLLVVPTRADVDHYRRELAAAGVVLGVRVERFAGLIAEAARRGGRRDRPLGTIARAHLAAAVIDATPLRAIAEPAASPRFAGAALELFRELEAARISPQRLTAALRAWAADGGRRAYADDVAAIYASYRAALERLGRTDAELHACAALDALRLAPGSWRDTPVFFYGFDDFTPLELDTVETLGRVVDAPVTVSLSYEPGRAAFAGRAATFAALQPIADEHLALEPRDDHYGGAAAGPLHHLERGLFEASPVRQPASGAVRLIEGGGERAELELVAGEIAALLRDGWAPQDIAVALRAPGDVAPLVGAVFDGAGVPHTLERRLRFADTALGGGLVAMLRAALGGGGPSDLLRWLRTPGLLDEPALVDRLEREARRRGLDGARSAALWESEQWPLDGLARLRAAQANGPRALLDGVSEELEALFARPRRRAAATLDELELDDAHALALARRALAELRELDPRTIPAPSELSSALAELEVRIGGDGPRAVLVSDPLGLRARRVRALAVCRLQEGIFPRRERHDSILSQRDRIEIARASGLALGQRPDRLSAERYLFYATVSRPRERLILSWHTADDDGQPALRSLFVDDVCDLLELEPSPRATASASAPIAASPAPRALRSPAVLDAVGGRPAWSASALELWARCPMRWLLERQLAAEDLEPESAPFVRGRLVHDVLRRTLAGLAERSGSARVTPETLPLARELLRAGLEEAAPSHPISTNPQRLAAAVSEVALDLERYLGELAASRTSFEPRHLELAFGGLDADGEGEDAVAPVVLCGGRLPLRGRIDRVDVDRERQRAIVYDYKGRRVEKPDDWIARRVFQLPLYMLAVQELLGLEPVGGFYQPIGPARPDERRARGLVVDGIDENLRCVGTDRRDADAVRALLDGAAGQALEALAELRGGALEPRPLTCTPDCRCAHPGVCRLEAA